MDSLSRTIWPVHNKPSVNENSGWKLRLCSPTDCLLWGQKLPGPSLWMWQWLFRFPCLPEPLQLHSGREWGLGGVREAKLHGLPVCSDQGGVSRVPALDGPQWPPQLLQNDTLCKSPIIISISFLECLRHCELVTGTVVRLTHRGLTVLDINYKMFLCQLLVAMKAIMRAGLQKNKLTNLATSELIS